VSGQKVDRTIFVQSMKMRVRIEQLNDREYRLSGTPTGPDGQPQPSDEVVSDMTALESIYGSLGLQEVGGITNATKRLFRPLWTALEKPTTQGWTQIRAVNEWKR
jgi:hypothetical protein